MELSALIRSRRPPARARPLPLVPRQSIRNMRTNPELDTLERDLKTLRVEFEKYFNGANDLPPGELQSKVERRVRELRGSVRTAMDRFRLSGLEAQNNAYNEMFNRRLRAIEEGRSHRPRRDAAPPRIDPRSGIVVSGEIGDHALAALYQGLYSERSKRQLDLDKFRSYIDRQTSAICSKTGCSEVRFRLVNESGKTKLKAKPVRD